MGKFEEDNEVGKKNWFKKGQSGNPKGRPKGRHTLEGSLKKMLKAKVPESLIDEDKWIKEFLESDGIKPTYARIMICRMFKEVIKDGSVSAFNALLKAEQGEESVGGTIIFLNATGEDPANGKNDEIK